MKSIKSIKSFLLMAVLICMSCVNDTEPRGADIQIGDRVPDFQVEMNNGTTVTTASLRGKVAVIIFFNTGCLDCQSEFPVIEEFYDLIKGDDRVKLVAISREEDSQNIESYWKEHDLTFPWSAQSDRKIYNLFATSVIPRIYFVDPNGYVSAIFTDNPIATFDDLREALERALSI